MDNNEAYEKAIKYLGELIPEQESALRRKLTGPVSEKELFEALGVSESDFEKFMNTLREEAVFQQALSEEELALASGGVKKNPKNTWDICQATVLWRIDDPSFPSCNATVEDGSWCISSDACYSNAITYENMKSCSRAWQ